MVKQLTNIPIKHGLFKEKTETGSNQFPKNSYRNWLYFTWQKDFQKQKLTLSQRQILDSSKFKEFSRRQFQMW